MVVEGTESLNIELSNPVALDSPAGAITTTDGSVTITDNNAATVTLEVNPLATVPEGAVASYTLKLNGAASSATDTTVDFTVTGDANLVAGAAAHQVQDYSIWVDDGNGNFTEVTGTQLTIPAGETSVTVEIRTIDDDVVELTEEVVLTLDGAPGDAVASGDPSITLGATLGGTVFIEDNDTAQIIIKAVDEDATEYNETAAQFEISLVGPDGITPAPLGFDLTVGYSIGGDADNGVLDDYGFITGNVFFAPGITSIPIDIVPNDDSEVEGDESVILGLVARSTSVSSAPIVNVNYVLGDCDVAEVTIHDNDGDVDAG